jgi:hypothetical protein
MSLQGTESLRESGDAQPGQVDGWASADWYTAQNQMPGRSEWPQGKLPGNLQGGGRSRAAGRARFHERDDSDDSPATSIGMREMEAIFR